MPAVRRHRVIHFHVNVPEYTLNDTWLPAFSQSPHVSPAIARYSQRSDCFKRAIAHAQWHVLCDACIRAA